MEAFALPDLRAPLDIEERILAAPASGTARGMFLTEIVEILRRAGREPAPGTPNFVSFSTYPMRDYMRLIAEGARMLHPELPIRDAMRRLGRHVYPNFVATMVGKAIFSVAGRDFGRVAALAGRAYAVSVSPGEVRSEPCGPNHVRVILRDLWPFPDAYQIGVWEGAMQVCGVKGEVRVRILSPCDVDYDIRWSGA